MITCSVCRNRELEGELFCSECGARLTNTWPGPTSTAAFADTSRIRDSVRVPAAVPSGLLAGQIALSISGTAQPVLLEGRPEYILGREGREQVVPDLNLNPYGARDKGVSRVHAALRRDHAQLLLVDLGSTNGTRLNGKPLSAHQPIQVENGDEIRLGKLVLTINFAP
jgi:hypothetical protein